MHPSDNLELVSDHINDVLLDIRYAGVHNFTGKKLYKEPIATLRKLPLSQLVNVADQLRKQNIRIVIFDAYRSPIVQRVLQHHCSDTDYVAEVSNHTRGITVDMTLADANGDNLDMGTDYDDFSPAAHADHSELNDLQISNRATLTNVMKSYGFAQHPYEWWHFDYQSGHYDIINDSSNVITDTV